MNVNGHESIPIPVSKHRTYVDPTTYASPDEAVEEFAREIEPKTLRLDSEIGAGNIIFMLLFVVNSLCCVHEYSVHIRFTAELYGPI